LSKDLKLSAAEEVLRAALSSLATLLLSGLSVAVLLLLPSLPLLSCFLSGEASAAFF
jgi:hypothetical protein